MVGGAWSCRACYPNERPNRPDKQQTGSRLPPFAELRARISLEDVIFKLYRIENLKRDGSKLVGSCPVHNGDSPRAFSAELSRNVWMCFTRNHGGNQLDFVAQKEGISIRDAALKLQTFFLGGEPSTVTPTVLPGGRTPATPASSANPGTGPSSSTSSGTSSAPSPSSTPATAPPLQAAPSKEVNPPLSLKLDLKGDHPHLLQERQLLPETIAKFGIGYCTRGVMRGTIAIPIHDEEGELVAYAGRRLKFAEIQEHGKYKLPSGFVKEAVLYNLNRAREPMSKDGVAILVEGFFSVIKLAEMGFANVVAAMGSSLSEKQAKLLVDVKEVILIFDGNEAGYHGALKALDDYPALDADLEMNAYLFFIWGMAIGLGFESAVGLYEAFHSGGLGIE